MAPMLTPGYVLSMARYNAWQNNQMKAVLGGMDAPALEKDRGAFFGSILATLNHLLWGDMLWMSRFDGGRAPEVGMDGSTALTPSFAEWAISRFRMDARILGWAEGLRTVELTGDLTWYSGVVGDEVSRPMAECVTHFFNHQTHHRGQVHAMATQAGVKGWVSDLIFMPREGPWL